MLPVNTPAHDEYLIVASSARYLVESACRSGYTVSAIDCFGDQETLTGTRRHYKVTINDFAKSDTLKNTCRAWYNETGSRKVVPGAGMEANPKLVESFEKTWDFFGNRSEIFALCHYRKLLEKSLENLGIPHPPKNAEYPQLRKLEGSSGGMGVHFSKSRQEYLQSYLPGCGISHLFAAAKGTIRTIGFNTLWTSTHDAAIPFCHGGAINRTPLENTQITACEKYAGKLARAYSLTGINSMDYLLCTGRLYCLELNPRPSATLQLYDDEQNQPMFAMHLAACRGTLPTKMASSQIKAYAILYCRLPTEIPENFSWPMEASDLPAGKRVFEPGEPLCTLHESGNTVSKVLSRLQKNIRSLARKIEHPLCNNKNGHPRT